MATDLAFALAGLGGFNAHGAGFLTAAGELGVKPDMVTATSGQIVVLSEWLRGGDLKELLIEPHGRPSVFDAMAIALRGLPGVFRPAFGETFARWLTIPSSSESLFDALSDRLWPGQQFVPLRTDAFFDRIVESFNVIAQSRGVGVAFNAYDLATGKAKIYGNPLARELWPKTSKLRRGATSRDPRFATATDRPAAIHPIDIDAVKAALWLSLYGLDKLPGGLLDGAYHRPCLVSELHQFDTIFAIRPLANGWSEAGPSNWFEVQDWQCEMWFSAGYKAEVDALTRINDLIEDGVIDHEDYKRIEFIEIAPKTPAGFFNFFTERESVFADAYGEARAALARYAMRAAA